MIARGKSHTGELYFYYFCRGRRDRSCDLPYLPVALVESAVLDNYATVTLPAEVRDRIAARIDEAVTDWAQTRTELRTRTKAQLAKLSAQENRLLDLLDDPDWPREKIAERLRTIRQDRERLTRTLEQDRDDAATSLGHVTLIYVLELLSDPMRLYREAGTRARVAINRAFFARLHLDAEEETVFVAADELTDPIAPLVSVVRDPHTAKRDAHDESGGTTQASDTAAMADMVRTALYGAGSDKASLVEVPGIEPGSFVASSGLLRAQLTMPLLGPSDHMSESVWRAQSQLISPQEPRDRVQLASLLTDAGDRVEGEPGPTDAYSLRQRGRRRAG